ncbi:hypothetical protein CCMSSC00406_0009255 [Pleurotus cornucopiae]|uniref:Uncharacterized protein n=1 Tax=Pleurotus cornucopiae TaxID=5321 RepID=A0ACB7IYN5_PLECO|nr:hypothetical protein CCMSSC00406_0009255 [Pleurotus cornucopiae]
MAGSKKRRNPDTPPSTPPKRARQFFVEQHTPYNLKSNVHSPHTQSMSTNQVLQKQRTQKELENILLQELQYVTYEGTWVSNHFCPAPAQMVEQVIAHLGKVDLWKPSTKDVLNVARMKTWPRKRSGETKFYEPFTTLLNKIVESLAACYPSEYKHSYLRYVRFKGYAKTMQESVSGEFVLKPDIVGVTKWLLNKGRASWYSTVLAGEVKSSWKELVPQAGTYARCLFAASDHRIFIPILALDHSTSTFRLLFYHRSGVLATHDMALRTASGFKDFVSTIVGMWLWREPSQVGYVPTQLPTYLSFNNIKYFIHNVVCRRQAIRGRVTTVYVVDREEPPPGATRYLAVAQAECGGREWKCLNPFDYHDEQHEALEFDEGSDEGSDEEDSDEEDSDEEDSDKEESDKEESDKEGGGAESQDDDGVVTTQELLLHGGIPESFIVKCSHQLPGRTTELEVFSAVQGFIGIPDVIAEYDALCFVIPADKTPSPWSVLTDTESDILPYESRVHKHTLIASIGQRLTADLTFRQVGYALLHAMIGHCALFTEGGYLHRDISNGNIVRLVESSRSDWKIPPILHGLVTSNECSAVLIDGDVAKKWGSPAQASDRSGTLPFISAGLTDAWAKKQAIVQTPIDDLESFVWVLLYDSLAWTPANERTTTENDWWGKINQDTLSSLADFKMRLLETDWGSRMAYVRRGLSGILKTFQPLIHAWFLKAAEYSALSAQFLDEQRDENEFTQLYDDAYKAFTSVGLEKCAALPDIPIKSVHEQ